MSHDDQTRSLSSGIVIAIVAVVALLLVGGLVVLGLAGLFFFRLSAARQVPFLEPPRVVIEERAVMVEPKQPMRAVELIAEQPIPTTPDMSPPAASVRKMTIRLDPQGKILADGQTVDLDQLKNLLGNARGDGKVRLEVLVEVDSQCLFQHVGVVQAVCKEVGVENVQVQALKDASG